MHPAIEIHETFVRGDMAMLRHLLNDPPDFPNCSAPEGLGETLLDYAIYWSPFEFIRELLKAGANANYPGADGFPSLVAAISTEREDKHPLLELLLAYGAEVNQRGLNDWTPLHWAAGAGDELATELLLRHGADPALRTRIDDQLTPLEEAERAGQTGTAAILRRWISPQDGG